MADAAQTGCQAGPRDARAPGVEPLRRQPEGGAVLSRVSQTLRLYLTAAFGLPPEELTSTEFCRLLRENPGVGPELSAGIGEFLRRCDERKFAPLAPQPALGRSSALLSLSRPPSNGWPSCAKPPRGPPPRRERRGMTGNLEFQYPWLLGLLALLPLYAFLHGRPGRLSALRFPSADLARAAGAAARAAAGRLLLFLRLLTVALCIVALAGPRFANDRTQTQASGVDIMLVLDLSWSMMALDMGGLDERVSRYAIASQVLEDFIAKRPSDRMGLIVFSAVPYLASPLTLNHQWLIENLQRLHIGLIRDLGTAIGDATAAAAKRLKDIKDSKSRIAIVLTDGDNNKGEIDPVPAAELAAALGEKVYTIGIGIEQPCVLYAFDPATGKLLLDPQGNLIPTMTLQPANYSVLGRMAALSKAKFYRATSRHELQSIYNDIDRLEKTEVKLRRFTSYRPLFQWPLLAAFGLFTLEMVLSNTRLRRVP